MSCYLFNLVRAVVLMVHMSSWLGGGFDDAHEPMGGRLRVLGKCEVCSVNG